MALAVKGLVCAVVAIRDSVAVLVPIHALPVLAGELIRSLAEGVARQLVLAPDAVPDPVAAVLDVHTGVVQAAELLGPAAEKAGCNR